MTDPGILGVSLHLAARLAYVIGVGVALTLEDRARLLSRSDGPHVAFRRFSRVAGTLMVVDCVTFILMCGLTRGSLRLPFDRPDLIVAGAVLVLVGAWIKTWAAVRIGWRACYWYNFFVPHEPTPLDPPGPYRYLKNPMYTLGYLYTYGLALVFGSLPGLILAAFDQASILAFYYRVEKPHYEQLCDPAYDGLSGD